MLFIFDEKKEFVKSRYGLSNHQFSDALNIIKQNRELKALLGGESELIYFPDDLVLSFVKQWQRIHPPRSTNEPEGFKLGTNSIKALLERMRVKEEVVSTIDVYLTGDQIAELEAIYYLGGDTFFSEFYEERVRETKKQHSLERSPQKKFRTS